MCAAPSHQTLPAPSATLVLLREPAAAGLEVLLVRRHAKLAFHGGAWVFPGGRIEPSDHGPGGAPRDDEAWQSAARRAAVREAEEEAGVSVAADELVPIARWTTPTGMPRRFTTWFFAAAAGGGDVRVDGSEIRAHRWIAPAEAMAARERGALDLPPPTFVTLLQLSTHRRVSDALAAFAAAHPEHFRPRIVRDGAGLCALYEGDAGYGERDPARPGARHRLSMREQGWRYERSGHPQPPFQGGDPGGG